MAQLVEQRIRNAQVVGSSPTTSSNAKSSETRRFRGFLFVYKRTPLGLKIKWQQKRSIMDAPINTTA